MQSLSGGDDAEQPGQLSPAARFPIDAVWTWVDDTDRKWNAARKRRLAALGGDARRPASSGRARFADHGELRYSMRSAHAFAPWLRRLFLVTAGQTPAWLDTRHPRVTVVDHRELLPADVLPTFNSHAIETGLHRIPGLSEHFVYVNDDMLLARPLPSERFFSLGGVTQMFLAPLPIEVDETLDVPVYLKAAWNNRRLLHETFGAVPLAALAHTPYAHRVSVLEEITARFAGEVRRTAEAPFRSDTDLSLLSSLAQYYGLQSGTAAVADAQVTFVDLSAVDVDTRLSEALVAETDFICLGDHHEYAVSEREIDRLVRRFLQSFLPVPAPWER